MRGEIKEQGEGDAGTSATTSDTEVAHNTHQPERVAAGRHRFLCCSSSAMRTDIASSSLRELDAVALATNVTISMKRGTKEAGGTLLRIAEPGQGGLTEAEEVAVKGAEIGKVFVVGKLLENFWIGEARTGQDDGNSIGVGHFRQGFKLLVYEVFLV